MLEKAKEKRTVLVKTKREARRQYSKFRENSLLFFFFNFLLSLYNPVWAFALVGVYLVNFFFFYREFLSPEKRPFYEFEMIPMMTETHYVQIGYEVYDDMQELLTHVSLFFLNEKERIKRLSQKAKVVVSREPYRIVGLSKNLLSTHGLINGTTGAGKTSLIMTLIKQVCKLGGGSIFVDGKSDSKMGMKYNAIAKKTGRETDFYFVNFLDPEKTYKDTNTFSPLQNLPLFSQIVFLSTLATEGNMSGDAGYWFGRGKALLIPVVSFLYLRYKLYGEPYSFETIAQYLSGNEFSFCSLVSSVMAYHLNRKIKSSKEIKPILLKAEKVIFPRTDYKELELLASYMIQNSTVIPAVEKAGFTRNEVEWTYRTYSSAVITYLSSLSKVMYSAVKKITPRFYQFLIEKGLTPESNVNSIYQAYQEFVESPPADLKEEVSALITPPEQDVRQHQYAQQQWSNVLQAFQTYSTVFGAPDPDVDVLDVIKNAKMVYFLLPSLQGDKKTRELLGKICVNAVKSATAFALGGRLEGLSPVQQRIIETLLTPVPQGLVILDEFGSYPVEDVDVILAQARSLNISVLIAVQDLTSLRVGGTDENSLKRDLANTGTKFLMKTLDRETIEHFASLLPESATAKNTHFSVLEELVASSEEEVSVQSQGDAKSKMQLAQAFKNGFSLVFADGRACFCQMFYEDEEEMELKLNRFEVI